MTHPAVLVTGATDGIGRATACALARRGWRVLVHGRDPARTRSAVDAVDDAARAAAGVAGDPPRAAALLADLASLAAVSRLAAESAAAAGGRLQAVVHNAGVYMRERAVTADGYEATWAVNHLAPFLLTAALASALEAGGAPGAPARVVVVASGAHASGRLRWDDLQGDDGWDAYEAYAQSKLANVLFARALAARFDAARVTANALHPGVVTTKLLRAGFGMTGIPVERGAHTSTWAVTAPALAGVSGAYFADCRPVAPAPQARDDQAMRRLWAVSVEQVRPWADAGARGWMDGGGA